MKPGALLTVLGPLGRGFTLQRDVRNVVLLSGGVGVAPLIFLLHEGYLRDASLQRIKITIYVGAQTAELLLGLDRVQGFCNLRTSTDDGSAGYHGLVTDFLRYDLGDYEPHATMIYACGPAAMIRSLGFIIQEPAIRCEVSLEERMACGIGACLGCAVAVKDGQGGIAYRRVCHEGPVFDLREIALNTCQEEQEKGHGIG
jgi:dihydroorotate dehydrogenase electron transfer subunit